MDAACNLKQTKRASATGRSKPVLKRSPRRRGAILARDTARQQIIKTAETAKKRTQRRKAKRKSKNDSKVREPPIVEGKSKADGRSTAKRSEKNRLVCAAYMDDLNLDKLLQDGRDFLERAEIDSF